MDNEIRKSDSEIYKSKDYRNVTCAICISLLSGALLALGIKLFTESEYISMFLVFIVSLVAFLVSLFIGHYKLFPQEEYENGAEEHDDQ